MKRPWEVHQMKLDAVHVWDQQKDLKPSTHTHQPETNWFYLFLVIIGFFGFEGERRLKTQSKMSFDSLHQVPPPSSLLPPSSSPLFLFLSPSSSSSSLFLHLRARWEKKERKLTKIYEGGDEDENTISIWMCSILCRKIISFKWFLSYFPLSKKLIFFLNIQNPIHFQNN